MLLGIVVNAFSRMTVGWIEDHVRDGKVVE